MTTPIITKHPSRRSFLLNLLLLGVAGAILIRLVAIVVYMGLPNEYFVQYAENPIVITYVNPCNPQEIQADIIRQVYPYLPENIAKGKTVQAYSQVELFRSGGRKIDDLIRTPAIEWKEDGVTTVEWKFRTTILPGTYYIETTTYITLPLVGQREVPIKARSNAFVVGECKPGREILTPLLKAN